MSDDIPGRVKPRPYLMLNPIRHYAWGTRDDEAFIPLMTGIPPEPGRPYAELWIGAHPSAPSEVVVEGGTVSLDRWIAAHPVEILGREAAARFAGTMPFLLKVLSAGEPLSIQAHPDQAQAKALHARDPEHYPDGNHKPELAVALDSLTALIGLKPWHEVVDVLSRYPELAGFIGVRIPNGLNADEALAGRERREFPGRVFARLVERSAAQAEGLARTIAALAGRFDDSPDNPREEERIFLALRARYPGPDVGLPAVLLLNLVHLREGQGVFIGPGVPHAYLSGNIVECMANSDNVVRVGLTPKFKDAESLLQIFADRQGPVVILGGDPERGETIYETPAREFRVGRYVLPPGVERRETTGDRLAVLLVTRGDLSISWDTGEEKGSEIIRRGQSVLVPALLKEYALRAESPAALFVAEIP